MGRRGEGIENHTLLSKIKRVHVSFILVQLKVNKVKRLPHPPHPPKQVSPQAIQPNHAFDSTVSFFWCYLS